MKNVLLAVHSTHRHDKMTVLTDNNFPKSLKKRIVIYTSKKEKKLYEKHNPDYKVIAIPKKEAKATLASWRQWIIEHTKCDYVFMMDDDVKFHVRTPEMKLRRAKRQDIKDIFHLLTETLGTDIPMTGLSDRNGNNRITKDFIDNGRLFRFFGVHRPTFEHVENTFRPEDFPHYHMCMSDFFAQMHFLTHGYPCRIYFNYAQSDKGSNTDGGCSIYRTNKVLEDSARWMAERFRPFVTLKEKGGWDNMEGDTRIDCDFAWKKAYEHGLKLRKSGGGISSFFGD